jgi:hypothetical protein
MTTYNFVEPAEATRLRVEKAGMEKAERAWDVQGGVKDVHRMASDRLQSVARGISRRSLYEGVAGICNAALASAVAVCFERLSGQLVNVDRRTWRVLVPVPWGKIGYQRYGLRSTEGAVLRAIMVARADTGPPFLYDADARRWLINLADYRTAGMAEAYLDLFPVTAIEVASFWPDMIARKAGRRAGR